MLAFGCVKQQVHFVILPRSSFSHVCGVVFVGSFSVCASSTGCVASMVHGDWEKYRRLMQILMQGPLMESGLKQVAAANSINNSHHHRNYEGCKEIHQVHIPQPQMQLWRVVPPWIFVNMRWNNRISQCVIATNMYVSQGWALVNQKDGLLQYDLLTYGYLWYLHWIEK